MKPIIKKKKKNDVVQNARRMEIAKVPSGGRRQHTHAPMAASTLDKRSQVFLNVEKKTSVSGSCDQ